MSTEYKGYNGTIILQDNALIIRRGAKGFLFGGGMLRGDKTIPYSSIVAVQMKKAGMTAGYIQLTLMGGSESKSGLFESTIDENSVNFQNWRDNNEKFAELRELIEKRIGAKQNTNNSINDLEKLAELKEKGVITEEEFQKKKMKILDL